MCLRAIFTDFECGGEVEIERLKVERDSLVISHLFFADDSLLFAKVTLNGERSWKHLLCYYDLASEQEVNFQKSSLYVSLNVPKVVVEEMKVE